MARILQMPPAHPTDVLIPNESLYARHTTAWLQRLRAELAAEYAKVAVDIDAATDLANYREMLDLCLQQPDLDAEMADHLRARWRDAEGTPHSFEWERRYYQNRIDCIDRILRRRTTGLEP